MNTALILAQLAIIDAATAAIRAEMTPPTAAPPPPPSLAIETFYGWNPLTLVFAAQAVDNGPFNLEYRAHESDATGQGPQEWATIPTFGSPNLTIPAADDHILEVRAFCEREGVRSEDATLVLSLNDYLPVPPLEETQPEVEG